MKIDWNVRLRNKWFWIPMLSAIGLIGQSLGLFVIPDGYDEKVNVVLTGLVALGVLVDPTTTGFGDEVKDATM